MKSANCFHARPSAKRRLERIRRLKHESDDLKTELEKATFEHDLVEAANLLYKTEIERKVNQRSKLQMWKNLQKQCQNWHCEIDPNQS